MFKASFRTKVLVPVIVVMALLVTATVFVVNRRITEQFLTEARDNLATADAVFRNSEKIRTRDFMLRFRGLTDEPRYQAIFTLGDTATLHGPLADFLNKRDVDIVFYSTDPAKVLAAEVRDPSMPAEALEASAQSAVRQAFQGRQVVGIVSAGKRLYQIVSGPVYVDQNLIGVLTFGAEVGDAQAQEFSQLTHAQIGLVAGDSVVASTLPPDAGQQLLGLFKNVLARPDDTISPVRPVVVNNIHYFGVAGRFESLNGDNSLGYVLLNSYQDSFGALQATKQVLVLISLCAIALGATVIWLLLTRLTRPLEELRDSAEAVGRGDFSRRVPVRSGDECGELAVAFNRMTENVQQSRAQLEQTVATLKSTQEQLIQSEKLSAVGEFVAGVAHELNNPLAAVMGFSEMLKDANVEEKHRRHLELIFKAAQRCQKIVQSLLSFARRHKPERKPASVNALVDAVLEIVAYPLRTSNVEVEARLDSNLPMVLADAHQIQQVLLNVINNARQAIESHQPSGKIRITTASNDSNIRISIQDSGPGISPENLRHIFDPFFTTKEVGKGTGLGLSLCYGLIKEHGGLITAASKPGEGATFTIELPIARGVELPADPRPPVQRPDPNEGVGRKILVIDDEEPLLLMVRDLLGQYGYDVHTFSDGEKALKALKTERYDMAFLDWKMPGLNGRQVYERLSAQHPEFSRRVVFVTGDVINDSMEAFIKAEKRPFLTKPFVLADLRNVIKTVLATQ